MNPCSVEDRTWTYQPSGRIRSRLEFDRQVDEQFERQLPPEVRAELETAPSRVNRWPARIPETEEEIQVALAWLKAHGFLREPQPPQVPPVVQAPNPARTERAPRRSWGLIWMVLGGVFLWALLHNQPTSDRHAGSTISVSGSGQPSCTSSRPVDDRRALPVTPRALPVTSGISSVSNAAWQPMRMPDGTVLNVSYQGSLPFSASLPPRGRFIGEQYSTETTSWVSMTPAGASFPSWVDP